MVLRTTGASVLASMMRAERIRRLALDPDLSWLLHGPTDPEVTNPIEEEDMRLLAAE